MLSPELQLVFEYCHEHYSCHRMAHHMQAFCVIKLLYSQTQ